MNDTIVVQPVWPLTTLVAFTTQRGGGVSRPPWDSWNMGLHTGDREQDVLANRAKLQQLAGYTDIQWLEQVHGVATVHATRQTCGEVPVADASWTNEPGVALAIMTADCVPVVLVAQDAGAVDNPGHVTAVGAAHGGWRGLVDGVLETLVTAMPVAPSTLVAWLGPAIAPAAYEIGADVYQQADIAQFATSGKPGRYQLDLYALAAARLHAAGVEHVYSERYCCFSDPRFFSYRRDGVTGRMATVVVMPDPAAA